MHMHLSWIATTNLAISSNETSQDQLKTDYIKTRSFLHAHFSETIKVAEHLQKKLMVKQLTIGKTYVEGTHWNCLYEYQEHMLLEIRKL